MIFIKALRKIRRIPNQEIARKKKHDSHYNVEALSNLWKRNLSYLIIILWDIHTDSTPPMPKIMFCSGLSEIPNIYLQCYVLWYIYLSYILVYRPGTATLALLTKEIPLRLLVKKKLMPWWIPKVVEIKISTTLSCIMGPVKLNWCYSSLWVHVCGDWLLCLGCGTFIQGNITRSSVCRSSSVQFFAPKMGNHGLQPIQDQPRCWGNQTEPHRTGFLWSMAPVQTDPNQFFFS